MRPRSTLCSTVLPALLLAPAAEAQRMHEGLSSPPRFEYLVSGTLRRAAVMPGSGLGGADALVIAEDGGRVRRSVDGGLSWSFATTPDDAAQMLLDVRFPNGSSRGYAAGRAGRLLLTGDGGASWQHAMPRAPSARDAANRPAIFWGLDFLETDLELGFAAGMATFQETRDGGGCWSEVDLFRDATCRERLDVENFELYAIDVRADPNGGWYGCCIGEWAQRSPARRPLGVVFFTHSHDRRSRGGERWWIAFSTPFMQEPWDLDFASPTHGFLVGGTGTSSGCILRTENGGRTWLGPERIHAAANAPSFATLYGVADLGAGRAIAVGYAGHIWVRDPASETWLDRFVPGFTGPLLDVEGVPGTSRAWACGSFGFLRRTDDGGDTWVAPGNGEMIARLRDAALRDERVGLLVGQPTQILRSEDGGASFARVFPNAGQARGVQLNAVTWLDAQQALAAGTDGLVLKSADEGRTWSEAGIRGVSRALSLADVAARSALEIWAVGHVPIKDGIAARALVSADGGFEWTLLPLPPMDEHAALEALCFPSPTQVLAVGSRHGHSYAVLFDPATAPPWRDVSPPLGTVRQGRGLLSIAAGEIGGSRAIYAGGARGTLLRWNAATERFEGIPGVFEFAPQSGAVLYQRSAQDITALGIDAERGELLVGFASAPTYELSPSHGFALRFDGASWSELKCGTNQHARAFAFGGMGAQRIGWFVAALGPGGTSEGTIADSVVMKITR